MTPAQQRVVAAAQAHVRAERRFLLTKMTGCELVEAVDAMLPPLGELLDGLMPGDTIQTVCESTEQQVVHVEHGLRQCVTRLLPYGAKQHLLQIVRFQTIVRVDPTAPRPAEVRE